MLSKMPNNQSKNKIKNQISIFLADDVIKVLEKRAKKNMFTLSEQIEDIIRRSCSLKSKNSGKSSLKDVDDLLLRCFSKRNYKGKKKKS